MKTFGTIVAAIIGIVAFVVALALLISLPVMLLWNWLVPVVFPPHEGVAFIVQEITWLQALGILLLTGFLFKSSAVSAKSSS